MKERESEVVRVIVVRVPAADLEVDRFRRLPGIEVFSHRRCLDRNFHAELVPCLEEHRREGAVSVLEDGMDRGLEADGQRQARRPQSLDGPFAAPVRAAAAGIVAEDPRREKPCRRQSEAPDGSPDQLLRLHDSGQGAAQVRMGPRRARAIEDGEVRVLDGDLGEPAAKAGIAQDVIHVLRQKVLGQLDLPGLQARRDGLGGESGVELDAVQVDDRAPPVARVSLEKHAIRPLKGHAKRAGAEDPFVLGRAGRRGGDDGRPRFGQESREDRERLEKLERQLILRAGLDPGDVGRHALEVLGNSANRAEGGRKSVPGEPNRTLERCLGGRPRQSCSVGELDSLPQEKPNRLAAVLCRPLVTKQGDQMSLRVGRHERLEHVCEDLLLLVRLVSCPARWRRWGSPRPPRASRRAGRRSRPPSPWA